MEIKWIQNGSGEDAYIGKIKIAQYFYNGVDSKNGQYKGCSILPQSKLSFKMDDKDEIKKLVQQDADNFFIKLGIKP